MLLSKTSMQNAKLRAERRRAHLAVSGPECLFRGTGKTQGTWGPCVSFEENRQNAAALGAVSVFLGGQAKSGELAALGNSPTGWLGRELWSKMFCSL